MATGDYGLAPRDPPDLQDEANESVPEHLLRSSSPPTASSSTSYSPPSRTPGTEAFTPTSLDQAESGFKSVTFAHNVEQSDDSIIWDQMDSNTASFVLLETANLMQNMLECDISHSELARILSKAERLVFTLVREDALQLLPCPDFVLPQIALQPLKRTLPRAAKVRTRSLHIMALLATRLEGARALAKYFGEDLWNCLMSIFGDDRESDEAREECAVVIVRLLHHCSESEWLGPVIQEDISSIIVVGEGALHAMVRDSELESCIASMVQRFVDGRQLMLSEAVPPPPMPSEATSKHKSVSALLMTRGISVSTALVRHDPSCMHFAQLLELYLGLVCVEAHFNARRGESFLLLHAITAFVSALLANEALGASAVARLRLKMDDVEILFASALSLSQPKVLGDPTLKKELAANAASILLRLIIDDGKHTNLGLRSFLRTRGGDFLKACLDIFRCEESAYSERRIMAGTWTALLQYALKEKASYRRDDLCMQIASLKHKGIQLCTSAVKIMLKKLQVLDHRCTEFFDILAAISVAFLVTYEAQEAAKCFGFLEIIAEVTEKCVWRLGLAGVTTKIILEELSMLQCLLQATINVCYENPVIKQQLTESTSLLSHLHQTHPFLHLSQTLTERYLHFLQMLCSDCPSAQSALLSRRPSSVDEIVSHRRSFASVLEHVADLSKQDSGHTGSAIRVLMCAVLQPECRRWVCRSDMLAARIAMLGTARAKARDVAVKRDVLSLDLLLSVTSFADGQAAMCSSALLEGLLALAANPKAELTRLPAHAVLRNLAFLPENRSRLIQNEEYISMLKKILVEERANSTILEIALSSAWALCQNNFKAKVTLKKAGFQLALSQNGAKLTHHRQLFEILDDLLNDVK